MTRLYGCAVLLVLLALLCLFVIGPVWLGDSWTW